MSEANIDIFASAAKAGATAGDLSGTDPWYLDATATRTTVTNATATQTQGVTAAVTPGGQGGAGVRFTLPNEGTPQVATPQVLFQQGVGTPHGATQQEKGGGLIPTLNKRFSTATAGEKLHDYTWQATTGAAGRNEFKEEVLVAADKLEMFALVQQETSYITVVHGVRKYYNGGTAPELKGKIIARMGDWTEDAHPHIVQLPDDVFDWEKLKLATDPVQFAAFAAMEQNKGKLWKPAATATSEENVQVPKMLLLPPEIAKYAVGGDSPRTAHELFTFVGQQAQSGESGVTMEEAHLIRMWCIAAGQKKRGNNSGSSSGVAVQVNGVHSTSPGFLKWAKQRLGAYLPGPAPPAQVTVDSSRNATDAGLMALANSVSNLAAKQNEGSGGSHKKGEEGKLLTEYDIAALKGYSGVDSAEQCTVFWPLLKTSKNVEDARANLMRGMKKWSETTGHEIYNNVFYSEECIKDIMKMKPNPSGPMASLSSGERGVSNLANTPKTVQEIEERLKQEQAARDSAGNTNFKEALARLSSTPKRPPENYYSLKLNIATTCACLFVLYGVKCDLYVKLLGLLEVLKEESVMNCISAFTPLLCRQYTWAIYMDCRQFFSQRKMPQDFLRPNPKYAKSLLGAIYDNVLWQNPVLRSTFPVKWDDEKKTPTPTQPTTPKTPTQPTPTSQTTPMPTRPRGGYGGGGNDPTNWNHLHPEIKRELGPVLQKFGGRVSVQELMQNAGIWWSDLPVCKEWCHPVTGANELCWNNVLGVCKFGAGCDFAKSHVNGSTFSEDFASRTVEKLKPGIVKMLSDDYTRASYNKAKRYGPPDAKRARR